MIFNQVSLSIIFIQRTQERPKLQSLIAIGDILQQQMTGIFLENMQRKVNGEKVTDLLLKTSPHLTLHIGQSQQLLTVQHGYVGHRPHKSRLISIFFTFLRHRNPSLSLGLLLSTQPETFSIRSQVNDGVCYDMLTVLHMPGCTNSSSSAQSKCR